MTTLGTDPELFLKDDRTGGVVPACGLIGGRKGRPLNLGGGYGLQEDNVMVEFNVPPAHTAKRFVSNVREGVERSFEHIKSKAPHLSFDDASERLFSDELLNSAPGALEFGCSQDYDAYGQGAPFSSVDPDNLRDEGGAWRFAGGHIHLGYDAKFQVPNFVVASFADVFLGLPAVGIDQQPRRRGLYGAPGRFRPTSYGIEYRVLSNFWLMDSGVCQDVAVRAERLGLFMESVSEARLHKLFKEIPWADVTKAITDEDPDRAADVLAFVSTDLKLKEAA